MEHGRASSLLDVLEELMDVPVEERSHRISALNLSPTDRTQIEEWLRHGDESRSFMREPPPVVTQAVSLLGSAEQAENAWKSVSDLDGVLKGIASSPQIAGYELKQTIGEGGTGTVWRAVQISTGRTVALKVMDPLLLASRRARLRFERELRLSARLQHPNIARVYDGGFAGATSYSVMELVEGIPLDEYVAKQECSQRDVLEIFFEVCSAVGHAHRNGVIHRDLKPSNILVDCAGKPHILDFGLARSMEDDDHNVRVTSLGELAGTIAYMSPEQAAGAPAVDTRSDVCSLGIVLYQLLTGRLPRDLNGTRLEALRRITESDPGRPSQFSTLVDDELDAITLKAMARIPEERYNSASELAQDVRRYLAGEPLAAKLPSLRYLLRKWSRKYHRRLMVASGLLLILVVAAALSGWQFIKAARARDDEIHQRQLAEQATVREVAQRAKAEAVADVLESLFLGLDPWRKQNDRGDVQARLMAQLRTAAATLDRQYVKDPAVRARLLNALGTAEIALGEPAEGERLFQTGLDGLKLHSDSDKELILTTMNGLAAAYQAEGRYPDSTKLYRQVLDGRRKLLGASNADTLKTIDGLCLALIWGKHYSEATRLLEQARDVRTRKLGPTDVDTLVSLNALGNVYMLEGNRVKAIELLEKVRDERIKKLGGENIYTLDTQRLLASAYSHAGRNAEAITILERVRDTELQKLGPDNLDTLLALEELGSAYQVAGRAKDAVALLMQVQSRAIRKFGADHAETLYMQDHLAEAYMNEGRWGDAITLLEQVRDRRVRAFGIEDFNSLDTEDNLALCYQFADRNLDGAALLQQVWSVKEKMLGPDHPATLVTLRDLAEAYARAGRLADTRTRLELIIATTSKEIARLGASNTRSTMALTLRELSYRQLGRFREAEYDLQALLRMSPTDHHARYVLACLECYIGDQAAYRTACAQLLKVAKGTKDRSVAERTAKACLITPDAVDDRERVVQLADFAVAGGQTPLLRYYNLTKGLAEYREGEFRGAVNRFTRSRQEFHPPISQENPLGRAYAPECHSTASFFLAMAQFRSGNVGEARETFTIAAKEFASDVPAESSAKPMVGDEDWLIAHIAFREAKALLGE